jgi:hypothetical protein
MSDRIDLVANEKPMEARMPPVTVANVEKWASQFSTSATPATKPSSPSPTVQNQ